jgi:hypothetical protein
VHLSASSALSKKGSVFIRVYPCPINLFLDLSALICVHLRPDKMIQVLQRSFAQGSLFIPAPESSFQGRKKAEIDIHGLKSSNPGIGDVVNEGANRRRGRRTD